MQKIFFLFVYSTLLLFWNEINAQSIWFTNPTNNQTVTSAGFGSTQTTVPLNLRYNFQRSSNPNLITYYIKLFPSPYGNQQSNQGSGISQWWDLPIGSYTWRIELWEGDGITGYRKRAEQTITFHVKHTIQVLNNFGGGTINVDGNTVASGTYTYKSTGENLLVGAIDQPFGGYNYVWNQSGTYNSFWRKKLKDGLYQQISNATTRNYNYTVASNDNGAAIRASLRKRFNITRIDQTEFDGTTSAGVVTQIVEQNNGQISAPAQQTLNGRTYNFAGWSDGNGDNPRTISPNDNQTYTALYKMPNKSNDQSAYANNSQRKIISPLMGF